MIEDHHYLLNKIFYLTGLPETQKFQREKFNFLNLMLCELCKSNNSKDKIFDISNHIILYLHLYQKNLTAIELGTGNPRKAGYQEKSKEVLDILKREFVYD